MGIFDFFRKITKTNNFEEIVIEKLTFFEIENWIERRIRENELKEKEILFVAGWKIKDFIKELREKIVILKGVDVDARKEKDEIKNIVIDSRKKYIELVEDLIERLNNLEEPKLERFIERINKIFFDFNKSSFKNYERATILIGKEMASIKFGVRAFSKDLLKTYEKGKSVVDFFKRISLVKSKLDMIPSIDRTFGKISETILSLNGKIMDKEEENKKILEEIEKIKKSSNYLGYLRNQKKIESLKEELKNDIFRLKQLLDFKALANFFHINEEQMNILKNYKEDFYTHFIEDDGKSIISLLDEAKLNNEKILDKIEKIYSKLEETKKHEQEIKEDETQELYPKIKEIVLEIDNLKIEKAKEEKRHEKLKTNKEELISILKQELGKMNVEVI